MKLSATPAASLFVLISCVANLCYCSSSKDPYNYGVIIDAGSSGTRIWIYRWLGYTANKVLPDYEVVATNKTSPGLSELADDKENITASVTKLLAQAKKDVPENKQSSTPIYLFATAAQPALTLRANCMSLRMRGDLPPLAYMVKQIGMRFLLEDKADMVFTFLIEMFNDKSFNPFLFEYHQNARILSGEEEGVFAWIAVNHLSGVFNDRSKKTIGVLELGGASTQIAFEPKGNILAEKFPVNIAGLKYALYSHSYLHFGQDYVDIWIKDYLINKHPNDTQLDNPCWLKGDVQRSSDVSFNGTGDPHQCSHLLGILVHKDNPRFCYPKPCAIGRVYQPTIQPDQVFYALSVFPMIFKELGILGNDSIVTPGAVTNVSYEYCRKNYQDMVAITSLKRRKFISKPCIIGLFVGLLLTKGYGFHDKSRQIIGTDKIGGTTADWTLGALIYEQTGHPSCPQTFPSVVGGTSSASKPGAIFISVLQLPLRCHSFLPSLQMTFSPTGSQPAVAMLIYLVLGAIFKRVQTC